MCLKSIKKVVFLLSLYFYENFKKNDLILGITTCTHPSYLKME